MNIVIKEELRVYIDPLTSDEFAALEHSLLNEGCRDSLVLWGDILVDGHNRYAICQKHGLSFNTIQNASFRSMEDVHLWMIDNHLEDVVFLTTSVVYWRYGRRKFFLPVRLKRPEKLPTIRFPPILRGH
jgi:hypothetical protein